MRCFLALAAAAVLSAAGVPAPCTSATPACTERVPLGPEGRYSLVYRSFALTTANPRIERALIVIHGAGRNANDYFASGVAGALIAGALENTVIISPRLASSRGGGCSDTLADGEISWICGGADDWRRGGAADGIKNIYTYSLLDEIIRKVADKRVFPNLKAIVVTGHSAGGQVTNRYAASTRIDTEVSVPIRYVVSNPSSYLYLDPERPEAADKATCANYNSWHYGLENRAGYAALVSDEDLRKQLVSRDVTYLLSELDNLPLFGFDSTCSAMAQGPNRYARGLAYLKYLQSKHNARHKLVKVEACGHNGRCVYTSNESFPVLFGSN